MRDEKQLLLEEIKDHIERSPSFLLMKYFALNANQANEFRIHIANSGGDVQMVPKRIFRKGAKELDIDLGEQNLEGHIGLILTGEDPLATTKAAFQFGESNGKSIEVIGGKIDGEMYDGSQMETLSKLPSKDEMRAQFLSVLIAPQAQALNVMQSLLTCVMYCLENKVSKSANE